MVAPYDKGELSEEKFKVSVTVRKMIEIMKLILSFTSKIYYTSRIQGQVCERVRVRSHASTGKACTTFILKRVLDISEFKLNRHQLNPTSHYEMIGLPKIITVTITTMAFWKQTPWEWMLVTIRGNIISISRGTLQWNRT